MSVESGQGFHTNQTHYLRREIFFTDDGTTVSLGWVPKKTTITGGHVAVATAFDGATTNTCDLGFRNAGDGATDDPNSYATVLALGTAGLIAADALTTSIDIYLPEGAELTATIISDAIGVAGQGFAEIQYSVDNSSP